VLRGAHRCESRVCAAVTESDGVATRTAQRRDAGAGCDD